MKSILRVGLWLVLLLASAPAAAAAPAAPESQYSMYTNQEYGFGLLLPAHWQGRSEKTRTGAALVFSGPQGGEQYNTTINVQVINRKPGATAKSQGDDFARQLSSAAGSKIASSQESDLAGAPAVRIICMYRLPQYQETFSQDQIIAAHGDYFYWVGFTAPGGLYQKYHHYMEKALASFHFLAP